VSLLRILAMVRPGKQNTDSPTGTPWSWQHMAFRAS
jgi:hypothetical protein